MLLTPELYMRPWADVRLVKKCRKKGKVSDRDRMMSKGIKMREIAMLPQKQALLNLS